MAFVKSFNESALEDAGLLVVSSTAHQEAQYFGVKVVNPSNFKDVYALFMLTRQEAVALKDMLDALITEPVNMEAVNVH